MDDLIAFLNARLDEDERGAVAAGLMGSAWKTIGGADPASAAIADLEGRYVIARFDNHPAQAVHSARHDPRRPSDPG
jgi:hypothetical protein